MTDQKKIDLLAMLQTAASLELATIPPYLTALLSIVRPHNRGAAENIRSVMIEEMLHLALVSNVVSSIGGTLRLTGDYVPRFPLKMSFEGQPFEDRNFDVYLAPFSRATIKTFMDIEQPRRLKRTLFKMTEMVIPANTIGEFYEEIINTLETLATSSRDPLFIGDPARQIGAGYYWSAGGKPIIVTDLNSARSALQVVINQGEGAGGSLDDGDQPDFGQPFEVAHYYRFAEIFHGKRYRPGADPTKPPDGPPLSIDFSAVHPIKLGAVSADYANSPLAQMNGAFNRQYSDMLIQVEEALNGNPKTLYTAIMNGMRALSELGIRMMSTAIPGDSQGRHGCPTFEWVEP